MDILDLLELARPEARRRIAAIGPDQWDLPTPCAEWTVRDVVNHLILGEATVGPFVDGSSMDGLQETLELAAKDPLGTWDQCSAEATLVLDRPGVLDATVHHPFAGDMPGSQLARYRVVDNVVHSWDIAVAIGADPRIDPDFVAMLYELSAPLRDVIPRGDLFDPAVEIADDAAVQHKLLALFGRDANWSP